ncbi:hypothetical protein GLAREA_12768 [Glarea lozoyensis ATCC 20868]|uniref:Uncharacterized protein n=2 Tax=Glarea lozoyensis TaxID=101852 RepID=S3D0T5_GLAL2|nr:uncharacterized protein GLAREA_12768 [Glarea lozoyensis ATCC 20868]EHK97333.1 hypothetical protein M7I_6964 [Glarea lozoyensis 74030]EPE31465.1 hypothetical protein GLAREA_12768 [Glarea lozoyensis ATCC 20868]
MSPNSRPPLTSRIRASFEGKRTKSEVTSPTTNGFVSQDPEAFRNAIDAAINSESFQNAIAANLARIIKPSIKDALDTLQPLVESVYSHEVLLRKTNKSVENILLRIDTHNTRNGGEITPRTPRSPSSPTGSGDSSGLQDIEQFKSSLEKNNKRMVTGMAELSHAVENNNKKIQDVVEGIGSLQSTLAPTKDNLESLKSHSEQSVTTTAVVQAQLDQLKSDLGLVIEAVGSDLGKNVHYLNQQVADHHTVDASHITKLNDISTDIIAIKSQSDMRDKLETLSAGFTSLKSAIENGLTTSNDNLVALGSQIKSISDAVGTHGGVLFEIKAQSGMPELLAAVQQSNETHASHASLLGEIKEASLRSASEPAITSSGGNSEELAALQALRSDLAALGGSIEVGLSSHSQDLSGVGSKVDSLLSVVETFRSADRSADILAAVQQSNQHHTSHAEALVDLKSRAADSPASNVPTYDIDFAALEAQGAEILAGVEKSNENHISTAKALEEIISTSAAASAAPNPYENHFADLKAGITSVQGALASQSGSLEEIKMASLSTSREIVPVEASGQTPGDLQIEIGTVIDKLDKQAELLNELKDDVSAEILTALHDVGQAQASHSTLLAEIREADVSDEILTALHSSMDAHSSHSADLEELKTNIINPVDETKDNSSEVLGAQVSALALSLDEHKVILTDIKDATHASNGSHAAHAIVLEELKADQSRDVNNADSLPSQDDAAIVTHLTSIMNTLEAQNLSLAKIEELNASTDVLTAVTESRKTIISTHDLLDSHTTLLETIRNGQAHEIILSNVSELRAVADSSKSGIDSQAALVRELQDEMKNSHSALATSISALAFGESSSPAAAHSNNDRTTEVLEEVKAVRTLVETSSASIDTTKDIVTTIASQIEINHTTVTTSVTTLSDELKAEMDATGTQLSDSVAALSGDLRAIDISIVNGSLAQCSSEIKDLTREIGALNENAQTTGHDVEALRSGVHFNEMGIEQLKEHAASSVSGATLSEGAWFKKSSPTQSSAMEDKSYNFLSPVPEEQSPAREEAPEIISENAESAPKAESTITETIPGPIDRVSSEFDEAPTAESATELPASTKENNTSVEPSPVPEIDEDATKGERDVIEDDQDIQSVQSVQHLPVDVVENEEALQATDDNENHADVPGHQAHSIDMNSQAEIEAAVETQMEVEEKLPSAQPISDEDDPFEETPVDDIKDTADTSDTPKSPVSSISGDIGNEPVLGSKTDQVPLDATEEESELPGQPLSSETITIADANPSQDETPADEPPMTDTMAGEDTVRPGSPVSLQPNVPDADEAESFDVASPNSPSSPTEAGFESASASTSAFASPSGPLSPLSPTGKKGKKGKKEKKEKAPKKKKEKVPFTMDGDEPDE